MRLEIGSEGARVGGHILRADEATTFMQAFLLAGEDAALRVGTASPSDGGPSLISLSVGDFTLLLSDPEAGAFARAISETNRKVPGFLLAERTGQLVATVEILRRYCAEKNAEEVHPC